MKVLHFILGKADKNKPNGVNQVVAGLAKHLSKEGIDIKVLGKAETCNLEGESILRDGFTVKIYTKFSIDFFKYLIKVIKEVDIVHVHGLYNFSNIIISFVCKYFKTPYIISTHNGLSPVLLRRSGTLKKTIFHIFFQKKFLKDASVIHVMTEEESTDLLASGYSGNVCIVPNGIDQDDFSYSSKISTKKNTEILSIGYLGRFSSEKNIDSLINAIDIGFRDQKVELYLVGPKSAYLSNLLESNNLNYSIHFLGPLYGQDKLNFLKTIDLFVHPSYCDVFSIGAVEVLASGTPLLITRTSNASYFFDKNAFYMCEPTTSGIHRGIQKALDDRHNWPLKISAGHKLITDQFNWSVAARKIKLAYKDIEDLML
jgi:glycosyltransferase involved in cell wall biosynthesis